MCQLLNRTKTFIKSMKRGELNLRPIWITTPPYWLAARRGECQTPAWSIIHTNRDTQANIRTHTSINTHTNGSEWEVAQYATIRLEIKRYTWMLCACGYIQEYSNCILLWLGRFFCLLFCVSKFQCPVAPESGSGSSRKSWCFWSLMTTSARSHQKAYE